MIENIIKEFKNFISGKTNKNQENEKDNENFINFSEILIIILYSIKDLGYDENNIILHYDNKLENITITIKNNSNLNMLLNIRKIATVEIIFDEKSKDTILLERKIMEECNKQDIDVMIFYKKR